MHPTVWVGRLTAYHGNPPRGPVPIEIPGPAGTRTREWEVACILDHKDTARGRKYLIDWVGGSRDDRSWEPLSCLTNCKQLLEDYLAAHATTPLRTGPPTSAPTPSAPSRKRTSITLTPAPRGSPTPPAQPSPRPTGAPPPQPDVRVPRTFRARQSGRLATVTYKETGSPNAPPRPKVRKETTSPPPILLAAMIVPNPALARASSARSLFPQLPTPTPAGSRRDRAHWTKFGSLPQPA